MQKYIHFGLPEYLDDYIKPYQLSTNTHLLSPRNVLMFTYQVLSQLLLFYKRAQPDRPGELAQFL